ncbi:rhodanese-like domain-containing protein [Coxiella endosymbiont of Dermacentor marginatus]|uniref:rhodanese-like domain-containing protein n=1 Tax=Coxiella endosymbiont of Dermacentor marginatus TaxID=1656159 RepID=UPI0022227A74|nr:rhodanese-like domain-containing protein [Coxiella endosymbiont of Dermacentor marginatus]
MYTLLTRIMEKLSQFINNHWLLVTTFIIMLIVLSILEVLNKGLGRNNRLTPAQVVQLINNEKAVVIDIRDSKTFEKGHITHAINIPVTELNKSFKEIEQYKQQTLIIVCTTGKESAYFVNKLYKQDYQKVYMLVGGMSAWINANMPVIK